MAEYYGYAERKDSDYIDWNKVGTDLTDKLDAESARRTTAKKELADAHRAAQNIFDTPNIGDNKTLNEIYLSNAEQAKQQELIWYKSMKNGKMNPAEFTMLKQNLLDSNKTFTSVVKTAQDAFTKTKKRIDEGVASQIEIDQMEKIQSFTDLNNTVTRIDPKSGKMVFTRRNEDGSPSDDPNDVMSIQSVITGLGVTVDKYFLNDEVALDVEDLAKKYSEVVGKGRVASIDDIRRNPEFKGALDNYVEAKLVDPNNVASILNQFSKNNYKTSYDIKDKGKEGIIYIDNSGNIPKAVITDKQKEDAAKIVRGVYEVQIGKGETYRAPVSRSSNGSGNKKIEQRDVLSTLALMYYGNETEFEVSAEFLRDYMNKNITKYKEDAQILKINRTAAGIEFISGVERMFVPFGNKTLAQFLEAARVKVNISDKRESEKIAKSLQKNGALKKSDGSYNQIPIEEFTQKQIKEAAGGAGASSKKRTIPQIMKEDNVSRTEATKIFKNQ